MTTPDRDVSIAASPALAGVSRRTFLAGSVAAGVAAAGLEGILAARRAPAFAQGTRLNIVRWVDFIPACDVELKRQAVDASKALGAEVVFEFINANDLQARITAAMQSGAGPDIIQMLHNWPHLYANGLVDVSDLVAWQVKEQGALYPLSEANVKVGGKFLALPHGIVPGLIAYRKSWFDEIGANTFPKTYEELRQVSAKLKKKGKPYGQTLGHTFGDAPGWAYPLMWNFGGMEVDKSGKTAIDSKGTVDAVKFMTAFWKDGCDEGGLAWDDTNNNRAFLAGEICATLNGASIYIAAKRGQDKIKDEKGEPMVRDIQHARLPAGPAGLVELPGLLPPRGHEVREEPEAGQGLPQVAARQGAVREVVPGGGGLLDRLDQVLGAASALEHDRRADEGLPHRRRQLPGLRVRGTAVGQGHRGLLEVRDRGHVRQGRPGHEAGGRRQVGGEELKKIYG